jgi:hypothetical protein
MTTRTQVTMALVASALLLAVIFALSPHGTIVASKASSDILGIDILGLAENANILPDQKYPTH